MSAAAGLLAGFHAIIAMQRNEPHWMLSDADAQRYGQALANALRHMPIKAAQKTIDYSTFVMMAFIVETPRVAKSVQLARAPKPAGRPFTGTGDVLHFRPPPPQGPSSPVRPAGPIPTAEPPKAASAAPKPAQGLFVEPSDLAAGPPDGAGFGGDE